MTLSLVETLRARVDGVRVASGEPVGQDLRLLPQRRHQAVHLPAMLRALADGVDGGVGRGEVVAHHDAALDLEAGLPRQLRVGPDAGGDDDQVAVERRRRP